MIFFFFFFKYVVQTTLRKHMAQLKHDIPHKIIETKWCQCETVQFTKHVVTY